MALSGDQDTIKPILPKTPVVPQDTARPVLRVPPGPESEDTVTRQPVQSPPDTSAGDPVPVNTVTDSAGTDSGIVISRPSTDTVNPPPAPVRPATVQIQATDTFRSVSTGAIPAQGNDTTGLPDKLNLPLFVKALPASQDYIPETYPFSSVLSDGFANPYLTIGDSSGMVTIRESIFSGHQLSVSGQGFQEKDISGRWVFPALLLVLILFTIVKRLHLKKFIQFIQASFAERMFIQLAREESGIISPVTILLGFSSMILWSVFIFQAAEFYNVLPETPAVVLLLNIIAGMLIFFLAKVFLYVFSGILIDQLQVLSRYLFTIVLFFSLGSLVLFPVVLGIEYISIIPPVYIIYTGLGIAVILFIIRVQRAFVLAADTGGLSKFYLFLYFCALEIMPLFLLFKAVEGRI